MKGLWIPHKSAIISKYTNWYQYIYKLNSLWIWAFCKADMLWHSFNHGISVLFFNESALFYVQHTLESFWHQSLDEKINLNHTGQPKKRQSLNPPRWSRERETEKKMLILRYKYERGHWKWERSHDFWSVQFA